MGRQGDKSRGYVFLSYKREEVDDAERIRRLLVSEGFSVWWDRDLQCGQVWNEVLDNAVKRAGCIVVLWSSRSMESRWVMHEASSAIDRGVYAPVRIELCNIEEPYSRIQATDILRWDGAAGHPGVAQLLKRVNELLPPPKSIRKKASDWFWTNRTSIGSVIFALIALTILVWQTFATRTQVNSLSNIVQATQRLANRLEPLEWRIIVQYHVEKGSIFWPYAKRLRTQHANTISFDMVDKFQPQRNDPSEARAWDYLMRPRVYVAVLERKALNPTLPVPITTDVPLLLSAMGHADRDGTWTAGPNSLSPPFYSRISWVNKGTELWLEQEFVIRNSPQAVRALGVISPIDISGLTVVSETPQDIEAVVKRIVFNFPTAYKEMNVEMTPTKPVMGWNRAIGILDKTELTDVLRLSK